MRRLGWLLGVVGMLGACESNSGTDGVLPGVDAVVFVKRAYEREDGTHDVTGGMGQVIDYLRYTPGPGSGLYVLSPPAPGGKLTNLTKAFKGVDINGLDLSFDASKVVFSMRTSDDNRFHIFLANLDGSGVRQLTFHDADDSQPAFLPGRRIAFVTNQPYTAMGTRADEYNHSRVVTQLATIDEDAGDADRRLCSQNLSHHANPFMLKSGLVAFSRWEHLGPTNDVKLFTMRPDCTQVRALSGQHNKDFNSIVQVREIDTGELIGVATKRDDTIQSGALMRVKVPFVSASTASKGKDVMPQFDEQNARFQKLTEEVPTSDESPPEGVGRYRSPHPLPKTSALLVSWADGDVNERNELAGTAPNFGLYRYNPKSGDRELVYDDPKMWDLYGMPVVARDEPPVLPAINDGRLDLMTPATLGSVNVADTSLDETVRGAQFGDGVPLRKALKQAQRVRVIEGFSSEIGSVGMFGLTMHEGAAVLGEARVYEDGSWQAQIPPYLPVHLQPVDRFDLAIRTEMLWVQAMPGESNICGGCHEDRTKPVKAQNLVAQQVGPKKMLAPIPDREEYPWFNATAGAQVQDVFDAKCVQCHAGGDMDPFAGQTYTIAVTPEGSEEELMFEIPVLDLSSRPISAYYERETVAYPASYVSLLYPSAMMGEVRVEGAPEEWVLPADARGSRLIQKVNVNAVKFDDDGELVETQSWAFEGNQGHPEDKGVGLTRAERVTLIRAVDLGGQYFSRRNVDGTTWSDSSIDYDSAGSN